MACADHLALDAERMAKADVQAVGQHDQPRRDFLAIRQDDLLPLRAVGNRRSLGVDRLASGGICARTVLTRVSYITPC